MNTETMLEAALPQLMQIVGIVLMGIIGWAATAAKAKWGIDIEAKNRIALHSALMTGVMAALGRGATTQEAVEAALDYVIKSVPDALTALKPPQDVLRDLATAKVQAATGDALWQAELNSLAKKALSG